MSDQGDYGTFSDGSGPVGTSMGRMNGGGWVDGPMSYSVEGGHGLWAQPPAAHPQEICGPLAAGEGSDKILDVVMGWDHSFMDSRRPPFE